MKFGAEEVQAVAAQHGFRFTSLEKVFRLLSLLEALKSNTFLRPRVALMGGTALNLCDAGRQAARAGDSNRHRRRGAARTRRRQTRRAVLA